MKKILRIIGALLAIIKISEASDLSKMNLHLSDKNNKIEYYSSFSNFYQNNKILNNSFNSINTQRKIKIHRNDFDQVVYMDLKMDEDSLILHREFNYDNTGLLSLITNRIDNEVVSKSVFGNNELGQKFFEYIFSSNLIMHSYNYYTEINYENKLPIKYKFVSMNGYDIGKIVKKYDKQGHLIREIWYRGKSSNILREFTSKFYPESGTIQLTEKDQNNKIIYQEINSNSN